MMKNILITLLSASFLSSCIAIPDATVDRPAFDRLSDTDKDGVIDSRDNCAATPSNAQVDNIGCSLWASTSEKETFTVDFDYDSSILRNDQREAVIHLVKVLNDYPSTTVELIGDTSPEGSLKYNRALAKRRVNSIAAELLRLGIDHRRIRQHIFTEESELIEGELHRQRERRTKAVLHHQGNRRANAAWTIYSAEQKLPNAEK